MCGFFYGLSPSIKQSSTSISVPSGRTMYSRSKTSKPLTSADLMSVMFFVSGSNSQDVEISTPPSQTDMYVAFILALRHILCDVPFRSCLIILPHGVTNTPSVHKVSCNALMIALFFLAPYLALPFPFVRESSKPPAPCLFLRMFICLVVLTISNLRLCSPAPRVRFQR